MTTIKSGRTVAPPDANRLPTSSGNHNAIVLVLCIAAGIVVGVGTSLLAAKWQLDRSLTSDARRSDRVRHINQESDPIQISHSDRVSRTERIDVPLPQSQAAQGTLADPSLEANRSATRRNHLAELRAYDEEKIQNHWAQPIDRTWSENAAPMLRAGLENLAKANKFNLIDVDCRNTSCVATFHWPNYEDAQNELPQILREPLDANCARGITLPEVVDPSAPLSATMFFDCSGWKKEGSKPLAAASSPPPPPR